MPVPPMPVPFARPALRIALITPAGKGTRSGNRMTAGRWARIFAGLGHRVTLSDTWTPGPRRTDCMVAIHAWRSAAVIDRFRSHCPDRPLVVLLAGTDINHFQYADPDVTLAAMACADRLVGLHDLVAADIAAEFHSRLRVIHQSAPPARGPRRPDPHYFDLCLVGHIRAEKDALRAAQAARLLPAASRIRIVQVGAALDPVWDASIRRELAENPRLIWRGEVSHRQVRQLYRRSRAMVISSRQEGGANVVSEAIAAGLPVLASRINGNVGLLGPDHPALFPVADTEALAALFQRLENDPDFAGTVTQAQARRAHLFTAQRETAGWRALFAELGMG